MGWVNALGLIKPSVEIVMVVNDTPALETVQLLQLVIEWVNAVAENHSLYRAFNSFPLLFPSLKPIPLLL